MRARTAAELGLTTLVGLAIVGFFIPFQEPYRGVLLGIGVLALFGRRLFWPLIKPSFCKHPSYTRACYECPQCHHMQDGRTCERCGRFEWV